MPGEPARPRPVQIDSALLHEVFAEARKSFPGECCGWLAGPAGEDSATSIRPCVNAQELGDHPTQAQRSAETAYVIADADLLALNRSLDTVKVIYHSHQNGRAYFSSTDHEVATSPWGEGPVYPVQQLVVGLTEERVVEAALFAWSEADGGFIEIQRFPGADL